MTRHPAPKVDTEKRARDICTLVESCQHMVEAIAYDMEAEGNEAIMEAGVDALFSLADQWYPINRRSFHERAVVEVRLAMERKKTQLKLEEITSEIDINLEGLPEKDALMVVLSEGKLDYSKAVMPVLARVLGCSNPKIARLLKNAETAGSIRIDRVGRKIVNIEVLEIPLHNP